jgi:hypothetical protein
MAQLFSCNPYTSPHYPAKEVATVLVALKGSPLHDPMRAFYREYFVDIKRNRDCIRSVFKEMKASDVTPTYIDANLKACYRWNHQVKRYMSTHRVELTAYGLPYCSVETGIKSAIRRRLDGRVGFGKHKGKKRSWVLLYQPDYTRWTLRKHRKGGVTPGSAMDAFVRYLKADTLE